VRATEIDRVVMEQSFRPGDIVVAQVRCAWVTLGAYRTVATSVWVVPGPRAYTVALTLVAHDPQVLSLGDVRSYYLTTARNNLGVVCAISAASGAEMVPVSWTSMECPVTQVAENRKVARLA
jgi:exosome complex RNA-binding protein Csl4